MTCVHPTYAKRSSNRLDDLVKEKIMSIFTYMTSYKYSGRDRDPGTVGKKKGRVSLILKGASVQFCYVGSISKAYSSIDSA